MFIFSLPRRILYSEQIEGSLCEKCSDEHSMHLEVRLRYLTIFWIPFIPLKKSVSYICDNCDKKENKSNWPEEIIDVAESLKSEIKTPKKHFIGLGIVLLLLPLIFVQEYRNSQKEQDLLAHPQKGDRYYCKEKSRDYYMMQLTRSSKDSMYFKISTLHAEKYMRVFSAEIESSLSAEETAFSKAQIKELHASEELIHISRTARD